MKLCSEYCELEVANYFPRSMPGTRNVNSLNVVGVDLCLVETQGDRTSTFTWNGMTAM